MISGFLFADWDVGLILGAMKSPKGFNQNNPECNSGLKQ